MQITHIEYPYPIISPSINDYKNRNFSTSITKDYSYNNLTLHFEFKLSSDFLKGLIQNKKANYLILIECNSTRYRSVFTTNSDTYSISINESDIGDTLSVRILIVSNCNIDNFQSDEFKSMFKGISFKILPGDTLAEDYKRIIHISKTYSKPIDSVSIFNIESSDNDDPLIWDSNVDHILIKLPKKVYEYYTSLTLNSNTHSLITNEIIVPILTEILTSIKYDKSIYRDTNWIKVLFDQLAQLNITEDDFNCINSFSNIAYKIFPSSLYNSFTFINNLLCTTEEEDN